MPRLAVVGGRGWVGTAIVAGARVLREVEGHRHARLARAEEEERDQRPAPRGQDAQRDQGVHGGPAVPQVDQRGPVERPGAVEDHRGDHREREPLPEPELQRRDHRHREHRGGQQRGDNQPLPQGAFLGGLAGRFGGLGGLLDRRRRRGRGVAGGFHGTDQVVHAHRIGVLDVRALRGEVDRGAYPVHPVELLLDPGGTGCAGHPADLEFDDASRVRQWRVHIRPHRLPPAHSARRAGPRWSR